MRNIYSEDYLREMELWSFFELERQRHETASAPLSDVALSRPPSSETNTAAMKISPTSIERPVGGQPPPIKMFAKPAIVNNTIELDPARAARIGEQSWDQLKSDSAACNACSLCQKRKQAVLGVGAHDAPWLFIGEGPGEDEDRLGEPFVGQAGKLLDAMLAASGLQRGREVYITNVVKCRPPGNRTPASDEALACAPYLDRQIDLIQPKLIVALGKTAVTRLTGSDASMASFRGRRLEYRGYPVVATYHPSYLLRSPPEKIKSWEDLMFARRTMQDLLASK